MVDRYVNSVLLIIYEKVEYNGFLNFAVDVKRDLEAGRALLQRAGNSHPRRDDAEQTDPDPQRRDGALLYQVT